VIAAHRPFPMNIELWQAVVGILVSLGVPKAVSWLAEQLAKSRHAEAARHVAVEDQVRALWEEQTKAEHDRLLRMERYVEANMAAKDAQISDLKAEVLRERADVADCQRQHAETRVDASAMKAEVNTLRAMVENYVDENADLKQQIVFNRNRILELEHLLERRTGQVTRETAGNERRVEHWRGGERHIEVDP
jgi:hypothetical protein